MIRRQKSRLESKFVFVTMCEGVVEEVEVGVVVVGFVGGGAVGEVELGTEGDEAQVERAVVPYELDDAAPGREGGHGDEAGAVGRDDDAGLGDPLELGAHGAEAPAVVVVQDLVAPFEEVGADLGPERRNARFCPRHQEDLSLFLSFLFLSSSLPVVVLIVVVLVVGVEEAGSYSAVEPVHLGLARVAAVGQLGEDEALGVDALVDDELAFVDYVGAPAEDSEPVANQG
mmetsp:Transcript_3657/g.12032  ORF Transcript_3657/g.12032 Transcript_3657/m.12032 type:complete len:229 (+) Transcript_3657:174-860(+)